MIPSEYTLYDGRYGALIQKAFYLIGYNMTFASVYL